MQIYRLPINRLHIHKTDAISHVFHDALLIFPDNSVNGFHTCVALTLSFAGAALTVLGAACCRAFPFGLPAADLAAAVAAGPRFTTSAHVFLGVGAALSAVTSCAPRIDLRRGDAIAC